MLAMLKREKIYFLVRFAGKSLGMREAWPSTSPSTESTQPVNCVEPPSVGCSTTGDTWEPCTMLTPRAWVQMAKAILHCLSCRFLRNLMLSLTDMYPKASSLDCFYTRLRCGKERVPVHKFLGFLQIHAIPHIRYTMPDYSNFATMQWI